MKPFNLPILLSIGLMTTLGSCDQQANSENPWPDIRSETKPWTRWWWLGSEVDGENIAALMEDYSSAGFGGVEITPIYGVKGHEAKYLQFLSPDWMDMLDTAISEADRQGMGVDMNLGTGWPFGGPQVTPELAASRLVLEPCEITTGSLGPEIRIPENCVLEALMAYPDKGQILDLTGKVGAHGLLDWDPGAGHWELWAAFCGKTEQQVKRAAPGGEGFSMDHFSSRALDIYLKRFENAFEGHKSARSVFNDSYEVYNASWTPGFFDEFFKRRGYDLRSYLGEFSGNAGPDVTARLKSDYRLTLSELLLENFTLAWTKWSHEHGSLTRNQAHGSPGNLLDLYAAVDIPECEIYGHETFDMMLKLATSAAHVTNKSLISNETFTWLGEHFKVALSQCKPEVEEAFLSGINHVFYHGTCYSPEDAPWPGWLFYASVHFGPTNSFWPHLTGLNEYITRCQSILQQGKPDNEVLVYWPVFDIWHRPDGLEIQLSVHNIQEWLHYPGIERMARQGYSYDFISDALLEQVDQAEGLMQAASGKTSYDVLVIPACKFMPVSTLERIIFLAKSGGLVVFEELPGDVPGFHNLEVRREIFRNQLENLRFTGLGNGLFECKMQKGTVLLCKDVTMALKHAGIKPEKIGTYGLKFTRRSVSDGKYYYLVNHTPKPVDTVVALNTVAGSALVLDPLNGKFGNTPVVTMEEQTGVRIQLRSGQSVFIRTYDHEWRQAQEWVYERERQAPLELSGSWRLTFESGGPDLPGPIDLENLVPWTSLGGQEMLDFSGTAVYTLNFQKPRMNADDFVLDLGQVHESARVWLNGQDLGILWSIPFEIRVGKYLQEDENILKIEVANLMSNRIRSMDRQGISWRNFHDINFVNTAYEPFDASDWQTEVSGLAGPVRLIPVRNN
ncbi:MAG: glycosyl hydrolase [Bacteroidota bacterium]